MVNKVKAYVKRMERGRWAGESVLDGRTEKQGSKAGGSSLHLSSKKAGVIG